jgi:PadR family transcriptional regulator, regulatory protein AphA
MNTSAKKLEPVAAADLGSSAYMVLAMVRDGFDTGYRIKRFIERAASFFWSVSYGQIYPELRRLEDAGLVRGRDVTESGRRRREYSLTAAGREELGRWLADPADPTMWMRNEGLLRLMLIDWEDTDLVRKNLAELRRMTEERLEAVRALEPPRERGRRIQDLGARVMEETLRWCDETEAELS